MISEFLMIPGQGEAHSISYHFLSVAAHYFYTTDDWHHDIKHLLSKLNEAAGTNVATILECNVKQDQEGKDVQVVRSWCSCDEHHSESHFLPCNPGNLVHMQDLLLKGQAVHWTSTGTESIWPDAMENHGLTAFAAFPVFVSEQFWGIISLESRKNVRTWQVTELRVLEGVAGLLGRSIEKEQMDKALWLDKTYYEELFHSSPAAIVILNRQGVVERINREFTSLFQYTPAEIIGKRIDSILPSDLDKEKASEITERILNGERIAHEGIRFRKDGTPVYVSIVGVQSLPYSEEPVVYSIYHDITERVIAQEKLRESQARFRLLFESANDAIFLLKDGFVVECNARTLDIFKCSREDIIGRSAIELSPRRQPNGALSLNLAVKYNRAAQKQEQQSFEWMHKRPDGSRFMAEVSVSVFEWQGETFAQAIVRDISSRKETEELLIKRYEFIAFLSRISADLINLDISCIDQSIVEILKYSASFTACSRSLVYLLNTEGIQFQMTTHWEENPSMRASFMDRMLISDLPGVYQSISMGEIIVREVPRLAASPEEALMVELFDIGNAFQSYILLPLLVRGKFIGFTGYFSEKAIGLWTDDLITPLSLTNQMIANALERKNVEQELKSAKEKAVESDRLKTAFLSSMSHEIRTPMNHILGFIELLKDPGLSDTEKMEFMSIVKTSGNLLLHLIDDIIDIAKLEAGQLVINSQEVQLDKFLDDLHFAFNEQMKGTGKGQIDFKIEKPVHSSLGTIRMDPLRVQQVISNLLSNAIKFTPEGRITLGYVLEPEHRIHFYVEDTGIGIPAEKHAEVFERFRQLDGSYAREYSGTGLGLAISKGLVELMKGKIGLRSEPGQGSRFFFTIPYIPAKLDSEPLRQKSIHAHEYNFSGNTILIVEDDEINYRFLEIVIHRTKAKTMRAVTGREAIDIALQHEVNLVLMDIQIPILDGYEATREIKKQKPWLPIIAQTAHALAEEKLKCAESGADDYLSKPISRKELLSKMACFLSVRIFKPGRS